MDRGAERKMELLDSYLGAVKRYLPRGQADDIIKELGDDLRSQIDDKATELGRPLTDAEQMAIFKENGDPMLVARRYRQDRRSLSLGWELIGPELLTHMVHLSPAAARSLGREVTERWHAHRACSGARRFDGGSG